MALLGHQIADRLIFFFFNDTATTEIYTLSLHDALPIYVAGHDEPDDLGRREDGVRCVGRVGDDHESVQPVLDRKSTRLHSSHTETSDPVFFLEIIDAHAAHDKSL